MRFLKMSAVQGSHCTRSFDLRAVAAAVVCAVVALCAALALWSPAKAQADQPFYDTPADSWYVMGGYIDSVVQMGLMSGVSDGNGNPTGYFLPEANVTRGQVCTILFRYANPNSKVTSDPAQYATWSSFYDVRTHYYYTAAIEWCYEQGIVSGYKDGWGNATGYFGPEDSVTRADLATIVYRFARWAGADVSNIDWTTYYGCEHTEWVPDHAVEPMAWCADRGIITGATDAYGTSYLLPTGNATRAQMAKIVTVLVNDVVGPISPAYEVRFVAQGQVFSAQYLEYGAPIADPGVPTSDGYIFLHWSPSYVAGETLCRGGMTFTAVWTVNGSWDPNPPIITF